MDKPLLGSNLRNTPHVSDAAVMERVGTFATSFFPAFFRYRDAPEEEKPRFYTVMVESAARLCARKGEEIPPQHPKFKSYLIAFFKRNWPDRFEKEEQKADLDDFLEIFCDEVATAFNQFPRSEEVGKGEEEARRKVGGVVWGGS